MFHLDLLTLHVMFCVNQAFVHKVRVGLCSHGPGGTPVHSLLPLPRQCVIVVLVISEKGIEFIKLNLNIHWEVVCCCVDASLHS